MEPEPERVDLSALDPARAQPQWNAAIASVVARGLARRRRLVRRGMVAVIVAAAAGALLWFSAPRHEVVPRRASVLDWATRDVGADDVLSLGGSYAQ